ncbi:hypothetical protein HNY73_021475 [Argiope bruennichi]|uniref:Uncharacterized protein n=1 Tax=Argiope bruennichi TaxID=94029 RepID=A0A8T0DYM5_ARGBR|nr:hypothetical protein HNY73_021475 [Argiope bruennichi]
MPSVMLLVPSGIWHIEKGRDRLVMSDSLESRPMSSTGVFIPLIIVPQSRKGGLIMKKSKICDIGRNEEPNPYFELAEEKGNFRTVAYRISNSGATRCALGPASRIPDESTTVVAFSSCIGRNSAWSMQGSLPQIFFQPGNWGVRNSSLVRGGKKTNSSPERAAKPG